MTPPRPGITIYQKPTCSTCREVYKALKASGVDVDSVNYYVEPLSRTKLRDLIRKMQISPRQLLRTREPIYKELRLAERNLSDAELIDLMASHPDLIQRPIIERGARAILARPAERVAEILTDE
jgi:arsenate reductase (glutaredoxin)